MVTSTDVPGRFPVAVNGRPYMVDSAGYRRESLPILRTQADTSGEPSEASLNPRGLWVRGQDFWHHGAGQRFYDARDSDRARFWRSKGLNIWTEGELRLLYDAPLRRASVSTNLALLSTGSYLYLADGTELYWNLFPANLLTDNQSSLETNTTGWAAGANTTIARSTAQFKHGAASLSLTATGAGDISATTPTGTAGIPVPAQRNHYLRAYFRAATTVRDTRVTITWYTAAGASISTSTVTTTNETNSSWAGTAVTNMSSPSTAAFASIEVAVISAGAGEVHYVDDITFMPWDPGATGQVSPQWNAAVINAGEGAQSIQSITTNGYHIWAALGTSGIHRTLRGAVTSTANVPGPGTGWLTKVAWANGRLLAAGSHTSTTGKNVLFEVVDPLGTPALGDGATGMRFIHPNTDFVWEGMAAGRNCAYAWGNSDGVAEIYRIGINPTDTSLTAPTFATYLPDGETIHSLIFYAGGIIMGTGRGVRTATADGQGNIDYGPLIETNTPVRCLEPQGRYCWFGWTGYDSSSTGLGRLDLGWFNSTLQPAYASDIMATPAAPATTTQGNVLSAATLVPSSTPSTTNPAITNGIRYFAVSGLGVYGEDLVPGVIGSDHRVASGRMEPGRIRYGTAEPKRLNAIEVNEVGGSLPAPIVEIRESSIWPLSSVEELGWTSIAGSYDQTDLLYVYDVPNTIYGAFELRFTIGRQGSGVGNDMIRWTAKALPVPDRYYVYTLPLMLFSRVTDLNDTPVPVDINLEYLSLKGWEDAGTIFEFQVGSETMKGFIEASQHSADHWMLKGVSAAGVTTQFPEGVYTLQVVTV